MSELVAYEQEIKNFWGNLQDNLQAIQDQFIKEISRPVKEKLYLINLNSM